MAIGDILSGLLGKTSIFRQFFVWNVLGAVVNAKLDPFLTELQDAANADHPIKPLSPSDLADMVVRGVVGQDWATGEAAKAGISKELFALMVTNTGEPPSIIDMLMLMRRGLTTRDSVIHAIKQSRVKNEWIDTVLELGLQIPTPTDILRATLEGQVDLEGGKALYEQLGGDPRYFKLMYDTEGSAPTPDQAAIFARRGLMPWTGTGPDAVSFDQAFLEGPWRNKWKDVYQAGTSYLPPPRTVTAMFGAGSLSRELAAKLLTEQGLTPELVDAYLVDGHSVKVAKAKDVALGVIRQLYIDQAIDEAKATTMLNGLGFYAEEAAFEILTWQMEREQKYLTTAIGTTHTQYINHRIDETTASSLLDSFQVPAAQRDSLLALWTQEATAKVVLLTAAEIKKANRDGLFTDQEALAKLIQRGYSSDDAIIYLTI
jgi:hypothetical protein